MINKVLRQKIQDELISLLGEEEARKVIHLTFHYIGGAVTIISISRDGKDK